MEKMLEKVKEALRKNPILYIVVRNKNWTIFDIYYCDSSSKTLKKLVLPNNAFYSKKYNAFHNSLFYYDTEKRIQDIVNSISKSLFDDYFILNYQIL